MRNIAEYPITKEEITNYMEQLIGEFQKDELCPDMRVVLLKEALKIVKKSYYPNEDFKKSVDRVVRDGTYSQAAADRFLYNVLGFQD